MGGVDGGVAFITGGARGQGRAHAVTLARAGADIAVCDLAASLDEVAYPLATPADLEETVRTVEAAGRRCLAVTADVRDLAAMQEAADRAVEAYGRIEVLVANRSDEDGLAAGVRDDRRSRATVAARDGHYPPLG